MEQKIQILELQQLISMENVQQHIRVQVQLHPKQPEYLLLH